MAELLGWLIVVVILVVAARSQGDRFWRTRGGFVANLVIGLLLVAAAIVSAVQGSWLYALGDVVILIVFGLRPAMRAHRDGVLYVTKPRQ
ncbi:MAG: hypothetical protein QOD92_1938 [Acidimicrobiaceae bacterium]|jgi:hypothetical protein